MELVRYSVKYQTQTLTKKSGTLIAVSHSNILILHGLFELNGSRIMVADLYLSTIQHEERWSYFSIKTKPFIRRLIIL
ncbi:hypothetical protein GE061_012082 [Apolygus lucorum]|uniref:Uncharacterized protein n=1 Tax=Apolygus lucorum TaxID=248454 RepID=A0A8S9XSM4_APOLU|nr:hypothetical protein GE061_012082 [Apolygus lucorum]